VRVTNNMLAGTILKNISASYARIEKYQAQLSSGKIFRRPSDNPVAVNQVLNIRVSLKEMDQYLDNIEDGLSWLDTADTVLRNAVNLLHRAKELAVRGANGTNSQGELDAVAAEVDQLLANMVNIGNTTFAGRYIFGGHETTSPPFIESGVPVSDVNYVGDSGNINYEIEKGVTVSVNLPGNTIFTGSTDVFRVLIELSENLRAGDYNAVSQDTSRVDDALGMVTDALMIVGAKTNRLELTKDRQLEGKINLTGILSNLEDADFVDVVMKLKMEENVYNSALMTGSMATQKSLIDFLK